MPTYDYECDACGHAFEEFQGINDPKMKKCPECKKSKLRRLFGTGAAIVFKGSGFYETDYRSESYKKGAEADKKSRENKSDGKGSEGKGSDGKGSEGTKSGGNSDAKSAKKEPKASEPSKKKD